MNFYYTLNNAEIQPRFLGNLSSFHQAESELRKLINGDPDKPTDGYLFLHRSALPWQEQEVDYHGPYRLVRIVSTRPPRSAGTVNLFSANLVELQASENEYLAGLPKAS